MRAAQSRTGCRAGAVGGISWLPPVRFSASLAQAVRPGGLLLFLTIFMELSRQFFHWLIQITDEHCSFDKSTDNQTSVPKNQVNAPAHPERPLWFCFLKDLYRGNQPPVALSSFIIARAACNSFRVELADGPSFSTAREAYTLASKTACSNDIPCANPAIRAAV
jgi:hypothetical protein